MTVQCLFKFRLTFWLKLGRWLKLGHFTAQYIRIPPICSRIRLRSECVPYLLQIVLSFVDAARVAPVIGVGPVLELIAKDSYGGA